MVNSERPTRTVGMVGKERLVCQYTKMATSKGLWSGNDPFDYNSPVLMAQIVLIFFITRCIYFLIRPLRQNMITAQILAGLILGPSFLARNNTAYSERLFPPGGRLALETLADFGFMLHSFILGVQIDAGSLLKSIGRRPVIIGLCGTMVPLAAGGIAYTIIQRLTTAIDREIAYGVYIMVGVNSMTSFIGVTSLLTDLNILNSEIGRLATATCVASDAWGYFMGAIVPNIIGALEYSMGAPFLSLVILVAYYGIVFFVLRPLVVRLASSTPEGKPMDDNQFVAILVIVLVTGYCADFIGQHWAFAAFVFGISLPAQPPWSSNLVQKLGTVASDLLLPIFCTNGGLRTNVHLLASWSSVFIEIVIIAGYVGKFAGVILASLYFEFPFRDASSLALIMCCKGIIEIGSYCQFVDSGILNNQAFALLLITMVFVTGVCSAIISHVYDPSRRYMAQRRGSLIRPKQTTDFRILVCIHGAENVPTIINLLETSNPTRSSPISVFVLQLTELNGLTSAILAPVHQRNKPASKLTRSEHIVNAFKYFERHSQGPVVVQHFTALAPYASIHDDICTLALDKKTSLVIVPYHKQWAIDGNVEAIFPSIRTVNQNVINKAPCSVGVLIDRGQIGCSRSVLSGQSLYRLAMLFIGGADDREALEYSKRMAGHPNISLAVVWLRSLGHGRHEDEKDKSLDRELMYDFRAHAAGRGRIVYQEEHVKDGIGTTQMIRTMEDDFDLFIVGRRHDPESPVTSGLTEWSECPELGIIGDMLATSDFQFSVLVMQQS